MKAWQPLWSLTLLLVMIVGVGSPAWAQVPDNAAIGPGWYRGGATLDMDFIHDQYWLNGTNYADGGSPVGTALANFISGAGATFTRAGTTNVTASSPPLSSPFFLPSVDTFVSRADATPIATYFNSSGVLTTVGTAGAGRTAAYTYNGSSWVLGGTLAEPGATNLVGSSDSFSVYGGIATITANAATAPDGTTTASYLVDSATGARHYAAQFATIAAGTTNSYSVFLKAGTGTYAYLSGGKSGAPYTRGWVVINLSTGSITTTNIGSPASVTNQTATAVGNGWYRVNVTTLIDASSTDGYIEVGTCTGSTSPTCTYTGSGSLGIYVWGGQIEQNPYPTSYIATSGSAVARAADVYSVPSGGTYFDTTGTLQQAAVNTPRLDYGSAGGSYPHGILIEESRTNSIRNNMMVGAVPADGMERTNNGTFSTTSPNVCSGGVTTSTNTLSCNNGTGTGWVGTVNGGTGSVAASSGSMALTGDGTNAASIYEAIPTVSGYLYNVTVTNGAGNAVTVQAGTSAGNSDLLAASSIAASATTSYQFAANVTTSYVQINNTGTTAANVTAISVQSAGRRPTNEGFGLSPGLAVSIVGTGTVNGIPYYDVNVYGTAIATPPYLALNAYPDGSTQIIYAAQNQTWTVAPYLALTGGTIPGAVKLVISENNSSGVNVQYDGASIALTSNLTRYSYTDTLSNSSVAYLTPEIWVYGTSTGQVINFTLRIGMPQLELGAFPTSVIPTYGSAVTRAADVFTVPTTAAGASGAWYTQGVGTLGSIGIIPYEIGSGTSDVATRFVDIDDGTASNGVSLQLSAANSWEGYAAIATSGSLTYSQLSSSAFSNNAFVKGALSYNGTNAYAAFNGTSMTSSGAASVSSSMTNLRLGSGPISGVYYLNGWLTRAWYMPTLQPNATLRDYTN